MSPDTTCGFDFRDDGRALVCRRRWSDHEGRRFGCVLPQILVPQVVLAALLGWPAAWVGGFVALDALILAAVGARARRDLTPIVLDRRADALTRGAGGRLVCRPSRIARVRVAEVREKSTLPESIRRFRQEVWLALDDGSEVRLYAPHWSASPPESFARELARLLGVPCEADARPQGA